MKSAMPHYVTLRPYSFPTGLKKNEELFVVPSKMGHNGSCLL